MGHLKAARRAWAWSLRVYAQNPGRFRLYKRHLRWAVAASIRQAEAHHWFDFLENPAMGPFLKAHPRLVFRPFAQYVSLRWNWARRVKVIRDTYDFVLKGNAFLQAAMATPEGGILARLDLDRGQKALIRLRVDPQFRKEGELGLSLELVGFPGSVTALALCFERELDGPWVGLLGSLQGRKGGEEDVIKLATKVFHGLRPKNLLLFLVQEMAGALNLSGLRGVGNQIQIFRARMNNPLVPKRRIRFDYDEFWLEAGGAPRADGWFELPLATARRAPEDIKPNKRSMYAKRYALMADLSGQIQLLLRAPLMGVDAGPSKEAAPSA
jgi:hypothetical protein